MQTQSTSSGVSALTTGDSLVSAAFDLLDVAVAANQQPCAECDEHRHGDPAAPQQEQCHAEGDQESAERRDEPARDDGHHARNAVYGALASPGAVGQRRTHGHHEYHIGRRQRQLVRSADGDQDRCGREVHDGADHVVRCRRTLLCGQRLEPPVDGLLHADGDQPRPHRVEYQCGTYQAARNERRAEALFTLVLRGERQLGLGDMAAISSRRTVSAPSPAPMPAAAGNWRVPVRPVRPS